MTLTSKQKNDIYIMTSGHFLTENLPSNFQDMDENDLNILVNHTAWEPFENWEGHDLFAVISDAADATINFIENLTKEKE